jgi:hypothetical protein
MSYFQENELNHVIGATTYEGLNERALVGKPTISSAETVTTDWQTTAEGDRHMSIPLSMLQGLYQSDQVFPAFACSEFNLQLMWNNPLDCIEILSGHTASPTALVMAISNFKIQLCVGSVSDAEGLQRIESLKKQPIPYYFDSSEVMERQFASTVTTMDIEENRKLSELKMIHVCFLPSNDRARLDKHADYYRFVNPKLSEFNVQIGQWQYPLNGYITNDHDHYTNSLACIGKLNNYISSVSFNFWNYYSPKFNPLITHYVKDDDNDFDTYADIKTNLTCTRDFHIFVDTTKSDDAHRKNNGMSTKEAPIKIHMLRDTATSTEGTVENVDCFVEYVYQSGIVFTPDGDLLIKGKM